MRFRKKLTNLNKISIYNVYELDKVRIAETRYSPPLYKSK